MRGAPRPWRWQLLFAILGYAVFVACSGGTTSTDGSETTVPTDNTSLPSTSAVQPPWIEREVVFPFGAIELYGVLTLPPEPGPHPAVLLVSGSESPDGSGRAGVAWRQFSDHSHRLAQHGFATLRYDPPGVGQSMDDGEPFSLDHRRDETVAALAFLRAHDDIASDQVGVWGESQGPWILAMTAARHPGAVAFLISVAGSAQTVAEQQIYGIEAQSRVAGLGADGITKALVIGRALIDWQLLEPVYRTENEADALALGDGPWIEFLNVVYEPGDRTASEALAAGIEVLEAIQDEPWAVALHLRELYIPLLAAIPADVTADQFAALKEQLTRNLTTDPREWWTKVRVPVLAFFGEVDPNIDSTISPALYERYLTEAGNTDYSIVVLPGVGHDINLTTPGYWETLEAWLDQLYRADPA